MRVINSLKMIDYLDGSFGVDENKDVPYKDYIIPIERGFKTDYHTVMWCFRWVIPRIGKSNLSAIVHDWLLINRYVVSKRSGRKIKVSREWCDRAWYDIAKDYEMKWIRRTIGYTALRIYSFFRD